jgi:PhzF family phenazine biosynthesis protein
MQQLARELNNGDTVFALAARGSDHDLGASYFTPRAEAGFVGHATLALHTVLAQLEGARTRVQRHRNGSATVTTQQDGEITLVSIRQPPPSLGAQPPAGEYEPMLAALGLTRTDLAARCPPRYAGANNARLLIGIDSAARLGELQPDLQQLTRLSTAGGPAGYFVFAQSQRPDADVESRMFCPAIGIPEDPVSGNAHGMLASLLLAHGLMPGQQADSQELLLRGAQGHHMDRPGHVQIALSLRDGALESLQIRGAAVLVFETRIPLARFD